MQKSRVTKRNTLALAVVCASLLGAGGCARFPAEPTHQPNGAVAKRLQNGAYVLLREASTPQGAAVEGVPQVVLAYDRSKYSDAPGSEPLVYIAIDPTDYVPLQIEGVPEMKSDGEGKSVLSVSLARQNIQRTEAFTRAHLGGRIAMLVDGEIVALHKIRSVIVGGKLQITRCTDNACEVIRAKLIQ